MNVIFTCGGTGGHINPAIAVANIWKERHPDSKILFICGEEELERELITKAGYDFVPVHIKGFIRYFDWFCIKYNIKSFFTAWKAVSQCKKILKEFKPEVILGTGGYASFPALMAGAQMGIPTCVHESNAMPGLTTRMLAGKVDKVMVCFQESIKHYKDASKVEVAGMPVRREFIYTEKHSARAQLGLDDKPVIVSAFGSQGAKAMNECMAELFKLEKEAGFPFRHIHAVGSMGWEWMPQLVKEKGIDPDQDKDIQMVEYLYNMPTVMAACDVIISRAGASTCNEIAASGTPCILIPSPNVTDNHQEKNARALCDRGGGVLVLENECTAKRLMEEITALLRDKERYNNMRKTLQDLTGPDSAERLCAAMEKLIAEKS